MFFTFRCIWKYSTANVETFLCCFVLLASSPSSKPFYRGGLSRGRGGFQQGPSRPNGPMQIAPSHQPGMMQPGGKNKMVLKPLFNSLVNFNFMDNYLFILCISANETWATYGTARTKTRYIRSLSPFENQIILIGSLISIIKCKLIPLLQFDTIKHHRIVYQSIHRRIYRDRKDKDRLVHKVPPLICKGHRIIISSPNRSPTLITATRIRCRKFNISKAITMVHKVCNARNKKQYPMSVLCHSFFLHLEMFFLSPASHR